jgi:hypothetical protein
LRCGLARIISERNTPKMDNYDIPEPAISPEGVNLGAVIGQLQILTAQVQGLSIQHEKNKSSPLVRFPVQVSNLVLVILAIGLVVLPLMGMLQSVPVSNFGQYVAPLTGVAGVAIGYIFGYAKDR